MYSAGFEFNFSILIRSFTTTGLQSTKVYTTIYNGACGAWINNKAYNFNEDGNRLPESWTVMIAPEDWPKTTPWTYDWKSAEAVFNGITYKIDSADNPSNDNDMYFFNIYRSGNG